MTLFYDTETTSLPKYGERSSHPSQPHLVEIGAILVDEHWRIVDTLHAVIRPMGWRIPMEVSRIHGITEPFAMEHGIDEADALDKFLELAGRARLRVAYNEAFDARIIRIAAIRHTPDKAEWWSLRNAQCAMRITQKLIGGKVPTLFESYEAVMGKPLKQQHTAMGDAQACMEVFKALYTGAVRARVKTPNPIPAGGIGSKLIKAVSTAFNR